MENMLDIFSGDAFSLVSLTDAINKPIFAPGRIGQMGLFTETGINTTIATIEEKNGVLVLVSPTPRGAPGQTIDKAKRVVRAIPVPHFEINDAIMAEEVQGVRTFGQTSGFDSVQTKVGERLIDHRASHEVTIELSRIGAVKGVVTYADGSTLDLFATFGVAQDAELAFDLTNKVNGALRRFCSAVTRQLSTNLGGVAFTGIRALCGDAFFDDLIANAEVRATYLNNPAAATLRTGYLENGMSYGSFEFGGITFENYRGAVGGTTFVDTDHCHIYPEGVRGLFRTVFAPADYIETVNTLGLRLYAKQYVMDNGKGVNFDTQTNNLNYCTRPKALLKGRRGV